MSEDSVIVDTGVEDFEDTGSEEQSETQPETTEQPEKEAPETKEAEKPELTEKGTKLDPNPLSALNQQLANERRIRKQYEEVLNDPQKYSQFTGAKFQPKEEPKPEFEIKPEDIQTAEDVVKVLNQVNQRAKESRGQYEDRVQKLETELNTLRARNQASFIESSVNSGVSLVQGKYPELNSKDPSYNAGLEEQVTRLYHELNYDPRTDNYTNAYPLERVAGHIMSAYNLTKKAASEEAQTVVKNKSAGKIVTSQKSANVGTDDSDLSIAERISRAAKRR